MANAFIDMYLDLVDTFNSTLQDPSDISAKGSRLLDFLDALDTVLSANEHFTLEKWLRDADRWAGAAGGELLSFNARSQVTVWFYGAEGLNGYSARAWGGLTRGYYRRRWAIFVEGLEEAVGSGGLDEVELEGKIGEFERGWVYDGGASLGGKRGVA